MKRVYWAVTLAIALAGCHADAPDNSPGNEVAPSRLSVGLVLYVPADCSGMPGRKVYTVTALSGSSVTVEQLPAGSGRTFTVPATCF